MNRLQFLKTLWNKTLKPILILLLLFGLFRFFSRALVADSEERQLVNMMSFGIVLAGLFISFVLMVQYLSQLILVNTPEKVSTFLKKNQKAFAFGFYLIVYGYILTIIVKLVIKKDYGTLLGAALISFVSYLVNRINRDKKP